MKKILKIDDDFKDSDCLMIWMAAAVAGFDDDDDY